MAANKKYLFSWGAKMVSLLFICPILLLCGCNKGGDGFSEDYNRFAKREAVGIVKNRNYIVLYNSKGGQYVYNLKRWSVRFQSDDQNYYANVMLKNFSGERLQPGEQIYIGVIYKESEKSQEKELSMPMVVVKEKEQRYWLWNEEDKTGLIVDLPFWSK